VCNVLVGVGIGFCLGFTRGATGQSVEDVPEQIEAFVSSPGGMLLFLFVGQAVFALVLWLATLRQRGARRIWLGMLPARISRSEYPLLVLGTLPVAWFGVILAGLVAQLGTPDDSMTEIWSSISPAMATVFVLAISIVPGLVEELFFRGHIQRRLLLRWPPACAIAVTALLFAVAHLNVIQAVFALPLGIWLGIMAWRTGSIWPGVLCQAVVNAAWNLLNIARAQSSFQVEGGPMLLSICATGLACVLALVASIVLLVRIGPPPRPDAQLAGAVAEVAPERDYSI